MVYLQRSRGYSLRPSLNIETIRSIIAAAREVNPDAIVMVDNCYGELVERLEPTQVGADLVAGSLIKNLGGGIAPTGGYIAGRRDLVEQCGYRLTCPGMGQGSGVTKLSTGLPACTPWQTAVSPCGLPVSMLVMMSLRSAS